jgi:predicted Rossmann fold flavoprotein
LSGLSLAVDVGTDDGRTHFHEDLLFTHRGLSGPAILQISSYWRPGDALRIDLVPGRSLESDLVAAKRGARRKLSNLLAEWVPRRLADTWLALHGSALADAHLADIRDRDLAALAAQLQRWRLTPTGSEGYRKAEVTVGGVDTRELSSQSMGSRRVPRLYFIGEVVDVTGWLGGYNFQWAWASAAACAGSLQRRPN